MPSLSVRRMDEDTYARLRLRAAHHGVSLEEEARRILAAAVAGPDRIGDLALELFGPRHGIDLALPERGVHAPIELGE